MDLNQSIVVLFPSNIESIRSHNKRRKFHTELHDSTTTYRRTHTISYCVVVCVCFLLFLLLFCFESKTQTKCKATKRRKSDLKQHFARFSAFFVPRSACVFYVVFAFSIDPFKLPLYGIRFSFKLLSAYMQRSEM